MKQLYIIESRANGALDFADPQPESYFGMGAITGMDDNEMAQSIFRTLPDASLPGDSVSLWPSLINPRWLARRKTW